MQVRWTPTAARDLREIEKFIRRDNPTAAQRVANAIFKAAISLSTSAERGRQGKVANTRELLFPGWPYILVYQVSKEQIQILRIRHGAQNWP